MDFLENAFEWADYRNVPIAAIRDRRGDWLVRLTFRDARGWFHGTCRAYAPEPAQARCFRDLVFSRLDRASAQIREDRLRDFNGLPARTKRFGRLNVVSRAPGDLRRRAVHLFEPRLPAGRHHAGAA